MQEWTPSQTITWAPTRVPQEGRRVMAMDVRLHESMDLMTPQGFIAALYHCCRLRIGGGLLAAPVCSSFVFMHLESVLKCFSVA